MADTGVKDGGDGVSAVTVNGEPPKTASQLAKEAKRLEKLAKFEAKKSKMIQQKEAEPEVSIHDVTVL